MIERQLSFFEQSVLPAAKRTGLGSDSDALLHEFRTARLLAGANAESVRREVSQLRALAREAGRHEPASLAQLANDLGAVARALSEPRTSGSRSTTLARLAAFQRFLELLGPSLGVDPHAAIAALEDLLPGKQSGRWHESGLAVAGTSHRRRRRGPTLNTADLHRIAEAAGLTSDRSRARNVALVALHCFSGLRPAEVSQLLWQDLMAPSTAIGHAELRAMVERSGRRLALRILDPAVEAIEMLAHSLGGTVRALAGPVFRLSPKSTRSLSYRAVRDILRKACRGAGLPAVESTELRAAFAYSLRARGLSAPEVAEVLGLERVRSVDRLLRRHRALDAQRRVREILAT